VPPWVLVEPGGLAEPGLVRLDADESRHLTRVLRRRVGDRVTLCDGGGRIAEGVVRTVAGTGAEVAVETLVEIPVPCGAEVTVALAVLHGQAMDWAVQKCVELGVHRFLPVVAERSQVRLQAAGGRLHHWRRLARQAIKQCRRPHAMAVEAPATVASLASIGGALGGVLADPNGCSPAELPAGCALLLVGPEGGLSPGEEELLEAARWGRLRLGPHTLRAETAAVVGAALLINR
jgi:16S rRNA (uracil1498-N3)-methyltransferase